MTTHSSDWDGTKLRIKEKVDSKLKQIFTPKNVLKTVLGPFWGSLASDVIDILPKSTSLNQSSRDAATNALITTGVSAVGSALARKSKQPAPYTSANPEISNSEIDLVAMRNAAEKAGFNPLTALRAGIGQGFSNTKNYPLIVPPLQAAGPNYGSMLVDNFMQFYESPYDREMKNLQMESLKLGNKYTAASIGSLSSSDGAGKFYDQWNISKRKNADGSIMLGEDGYPLYTDLIMANEAQPQYLPIYDRTTGLTFPYMNPDLYDMGPAEVISGTGMLASAQALSWSLGKPVSPPPRNNQPMRIILDNPGNQ